LELAYTSAQAHDAEKTTITLQTIQAPNPTTTHILSFDHENRQEFCMLQDWMPLPSFR